MGNPNETTKIMRALKIVGSVQGLEAYQAVTRAGKGQTYSKYRLILPENYLAAAKLKPHTQLPFLPSNSEQTIDNINSPLELNGFEIFESRKMFESFIKRYAKEPVKMDAARADMGLADLSIGGVLAFSPAYVLLPRRYTLVRHAEEGRCVACAII
jgi:hypothetical protein